MLRARTLLVLALMAGVVALSAVLFACSQTPTSVPIRTFERAQRVDVVCLRVFGPDAPEALNQEACAPVPPEVNGGGLDNQLFALVTQTTRGEVAVVDLSAGTIIDQRRPIPGLNFLPVGANPTDVAATPDGRMIFVASAEPNKFAIYGIPGHRILGDQAARRDPDGPIALSSWPVCTLPQRPGSLSIVPRRPTPGVTTDGGVGLEIPYELVAVLPGDRSNSAKVVTLDPRPFLRGSPRKSSETGLPLDDFGPGAVLAPGQLGPCPITSAIELSGEEALPTSFRSGGAWQDGVPWVDGGVDLRCSTPTALASCGLRSCACPSIDVPPDAGADAGDAGEPPAAGPCEADAGRNDDPEQVLDLGPLDRPEPVAIARDDQTLYVADDGVPLIHVLDLSTPGAPKELPPFVVTSSVDPSRVVSIRALAISPPTHDFKRFLYAVDRKEGSIAVFDVSDPATAERTPMRRPHAELNPFQPPDRISFASPVVSIAFARHDVPVSRIAGQTISNPKTGILCNPNQNVNPNAPETNGAQYRADSQSVDVALGPRPTPGRLRGVFAFATLSSGQVVAIDVDDWDAPCRRPALLNGVPSDTSTTGVLAIAQPQATDGADLDPYHAPDLTQFATTVSQEMFFPVSAPHRARSNYFLRDDANTGKHIPFLSFTPTITSAGSISPPVTGQGSESTPRLRPTAALPGDPRGTQDIGVRFAFDAPDVHFDQDWTVTYEGILPGFEGLPAAMSTSDNYASLTLSQPQARFCAKGVEDWALGQERASGITTALAESLRAPYPEPLGQKMADYVQVNEELLGVNDPYWQQPDLEGANGCWDDALDAPATSAAELGHRRYDFCASQFGSANEQSRNRDFPIVEAYDDRVVLGTFSQGAQLSSPNVVAGPQCAPYLKALRCCFHHQVKFAVRTGAEWVAVGSTVGLLNRVTPGAGGRCVASCDPNAVLRNARVPSLPFTNGDFAPVRDSALALRNPSFSFFIQNGYVPNGTVKTDKAPDRDMTYRFQTRGAFQALVINLAATTISVNPQSMRFIESLGQLAVVDGSSQGLVLIDLAGVAIARAPYF